MTLLKIRKYPDPILKKKSEEVRVITFEIKKLVEDMKETMKANEGVGLAAPQIGVSKRVIVVETPEGTLAFINPKIVGNAKEIEVFLEGCLSVPGVFLNIKRRKEVEVEALDEEGKKVRVKATGILARAFQQEIDHLNGFLILDRVNFFQRWLAKRKIKK